MAVVNPEPIRQKQRRPTKPKGTSTEVGGWNEDAATKIRSNANSNEESSRPVTRAAKRRLEEATLRVEGAGVTTPTVGSSTNAAILAPEEGHVLARFDHEEPHHSGKHAEAGPVKVPAKRPRKRVTWADGWSATEEEATTSMRQKTASSPPRLATARASDMTTMTTTSRSTTAAPREADQRTTPRERNADAAPQAAGIKQREGVTIRAKQPTQTKKTGTMTLQQLEAETQTKATTSTGSRPTTALWPTTTSATPTKPRSARAENSVLRGEESWREPTAHPTKTQRIEKPTTNRATLQLTDEEIVAAQQRSRLVQRLLAQGTYHGMKVFKHNELVLISTVNGKRVLLPPQLWAPVFKEHHDSVWAGHLRAPHT
ncbi:hypothetical protein PR002_g23478 [Phytophthora rubi]|nr:hypothetical protein PR002_g23478 [Phytophthora rubi]